MTRSIRGFVAFEQDGSQPRAIRAILGLVECQSVGAPALVQDARIGIERRTGCRIQELDAVELYAGAPGRLAHDLFPAEQRQAGEALSDNLRRRGDHARVFSLRQHDVLPPRARAAFQFFQDVHSCFTVPHLPAPRMPTTCRSNDLACMK